MNPFAIFGGFLALVAAGVAIYLAFALSIYIFKGTVEHLKRGVRL